MNRRSKIFIYILISIIVLWIIHHYIFNIYEVTYTSSPDDIFADNLTEIKIETNPINALGWSVPFRSVESNFEIIEGIDLVEVIEHNNTKGFIKLKVKKLHGIVVARAKSKYSLLPALIEVRIQLNNV